jgi:ABC-type Co2+ transport system permease subunit
MIDVTEVIKRIIKYLVMGIVVAVVSYVIPKQKLNVEEIMVIVLSAAATFAIIETFLPSTVTDAVHSGLGWGTGASFSPFGRLPGGII